MVYFHPSKIFFKMIKNSLNSYRAQFRNIGNSSMPHSAKFITLISFATQIWSQLILLTVPKIPFMLQCSKNRIAYVSIFSTQTLVSTSLDMANIGEQLQNRIEPIIRDFIDSMELGVPRCVVTSQRKSNSCLVLVRLRKGLNFKHSFFKAGFSISTFEDVQYLKKVFGHHLRSLEALPSFK